MKTILNILGGSILGLGLLMISGCGGDSSGDSCSNAAPCGGNNVGTWLITSSCVSATASMFSMDCPTATVKSSNLKITGTVVYSAAMTYTANTSVSGTVSVTLPASCLMSTGISVTCDQLTQLLQQTPGLEATTCTGAAACTCNVTTTNMASTETGTFTTTAAGLLTETASDGSIAQSDYCVKGTTLTVSPREGSSTMGSLSGTITLAKQ